MRGEVLGSGSMGIVYEALQQPLGRKVALKLPRRELRAAPWVRARFRAEAFAGGRLRHPGIVPVFDFGEDEGVPFLVTEHVPGRLLGDLVARKGPLDLGAVLDLGEQLLAALAEIHAAGIVHGDVRCDNVLIEPLRTGQLRARLFDFGLATIAGEAPLAGTDHATFDGPPSTATDLRGFGALLYHLLTGTPPAPGEVVAPSRRAPDRELPQALDALVMRALAPQHAEPFHDASACVRALRAAISAAPAQIAPRTGSGPTVLGDPSAGVVDSSQILRRRQAVEDAILGGEDDQIVAAYLDLARSLIHAGRHATAALELEQCAALIEQPGRPGPAWRVSLTLAALYSGLGESRAAACARTAGAVAIR